MSPQRGRCPCGRGSTPRCGAHPARVARRALTVHQVVLTLQLRVNWREVGGGGCGEEGTVTRGLLGRELSRSNKDAHPSPQGLQASFPVCLCPR